MNGISSALRRLGSDVASRGVASLSMLLVVGLLLAAAIAPSRAAIAFAEAPAATVLAVQDIDHVEVTPAAAAARDSFGGLAKPMAPVAATPKPGTSKAIALELVTARGWDLNQYDCLVALWEKESRWDVYAENKTSGAYGIPQALPGSKMASAGADWKTNPRTQIIWGLDYIERRYATPCGAWEHSQANHWY